MCALLHQNNKELQIRTGLVYSLPVMATSTFPSMFNWTRIQSALMFVLVGMMDTFQRRRHSDQYLMSVNSLVAGVYIRTREEQSTFSGKICTRTEQRDRSHFKPNADPNLRTLLAPALYRTPCQPEAKAKRDKHCSYRSPTRNLDA